MNPEINKALIYLLAVVVASGAWIAVELLRLSGSRYSIESGGALQRTFLLDRQTGQVWGYYVNMDENKKPTDEGFQLIKQ
jgi:hypothetical protein